MSDFSGTLISIMSSSPMRPEEGQLYKATWLPAGRGAEVRRSRWVPKKGRCWNDPPEWTLLIPTFGPPHPLRIGRAWL